MATEQGKALAASSQKAGKSSAVVSKLTPRSPAPVEAKTSRSPSASVPKGTLPTKLAGAAPKVAAKAKVGSFGSAPRRQPEKDVKGSATSTDKAVARPKSRPVAIRGGGKREAQPLATLRAQAEDTVQDEEADENTTGQPPQPQDYLEPPLPADSLSLQLVQSGQEASLDPSVNANSDEEMPADQTSATTQKSTTQTSTRKRMSLAQEAVRSFANANESFEASEAGASPSRPRPPALRLSMSSDGGHTRFRAQSSSRRSSSSPKNADEEAESPSRTSQDWSSSLRSETPREQRSSSKTFPSGARVPYTGQTRRSSNQEAQLTEPAENSSTAKVVLRETTPTDELDSEFQRLQERAVKQSLKVPEASHQERRRQTIVSEQKRQKDEAANTDRESEQQQQSWQQRWQQQTSQSEMQEDKQTNQMPSDRVTSKSRNQASSDSEDAADTGAEADVEAERQAARKYLDSPELPGTSEHVRTMEVVPGDASQNRQLKGNHGKLEAAQESDVIKPASISNAMNELLQADSPVSTTATIAQPDALPALLQEVYQKIQLCSAKLYGESHLPDAIADGGAFDYHDTWQDVELLRQAVVGMHSHLLLAQKRQRVLETECQEFQKRLRELGVVEQSSESTSDAKGRPPTLVPSLSLPGNLLSPPVRLYSRGNVKSTSALPSQPVSSTALAAVNPIISSQTTQTPRSVGPGRDPASRSVSPARNYHVHSTVMNAGTPSTPSYSSTVPRHMVYTTSPVYAAPQGPFLLSTASSTGSIPAHLTPRSVSASPQRQLPQQASSPVAVNFSSLQQGAGTFTASPSPVIASPRPQRSASASSFQGRGGCPRSQADSAIFHYIPREQTPQRVPAVQRVVMPCAQNLLYGVPGSVAALRMRGIQ